MNHMQKMIGKTVASEPAMFDALYESIMTDGKIMYLGKLLQRSAELFPDKTVLICEDKQITYRDLYHRAVLFSQKLIANGVQPKDRVLIFIENSIEFYIAYFGISQVGAVVAPLNVYLKEKELAHIINDAQPKLLIMQSKFIELFKETGLSLPPILTEQDIAFEQKLEGGVPSFEVRTLEPDEMAALLYTSGTTGLPKGVMLSSKNIMTNVVQIIARLKLKEYERVFGVLPLFHSFAQIGTVWASLFAGATVILVPKVDRRKILAGLHQQPTIVLGVPALYGLFCLLKTAPFPKVKYFVSGGDALPDKIRGAFGMIYRRKICSGYGLTETSPLISIDLGDELQPTSNVGKPVIGVECLILDKKGTTLPQGEIGEICVKGDNVMLGYYNAQEKTDEMIQDGVLHTGDLGYIDKKGKIVITGRIKDLIISKGFNIYPQEVENVIMGHPNVMRVGVIGKPDESEGQIPIAFVQIRKQEPGIEGTLKKLCKQHLASYKIPRSFLCSVNELPTTTTGKVDKKVLRKQL